MPHMQEVGLKEDNSKDARSESMYATVSKHCNLPRYQS